MNINTIQQHYDVNQVDTYAGLAVYRVSEKMTASQMHCDTCSCVPEPVVIPDNQARMKL